MWEIAAQAEPWPAVQGAFLADQLLGRIRAGERPVVSSHWPTAYVALMARCWSMEPASRPAFPHIAEALAGGPA
eukprot:m.114663 g.114663  ORF g.114663 m.114663 type:complete len:74 (+) comp9164_c0_seq2:2-223(+)